MYLWCNSIIARIWHRLVLIDFPFMCTAAFTLKFALFSCNCLSSGLLGAKLYFKFRKDLNIQYQRSVSCRIPWRFSWKINWGLNLGYWSWKPCSFLSTSTKRKIFYSLTQQERHNYQDVRSANTCPCPFQIQVHWLAEWKTLKLQSLLREKKVRLTFSYATFLVLCSLIFPRYKLGMSSLFIVLHKIKILYSKNALAFTQIH